VSEDLPEGLRAFVEDDVALLPSGLTEPERAQLIATLLERQDAQRLDRLGASPDKALAKSARRALHLLKTRGAAPAVVPPRVYRVEGPYSSAPQGPPSWATTIDGMGERVVWYVEESDRGVAIYESELSEGRGMLSLTAVEAPKKAWRERLQQMQRSQRALIGAIPAVHARVLIERAFRKTREVGRTPPEEYVRNRRALQLRDEFLEQPHPLRERFVTGEATDAELAALLDRPELAMLMPPQAALETLDTAVTDIATSKLIVDSAERQTQIEAAIDRVLDEVLTLEVRTRLADRILEMGLLISTRQPDDAGQALARQCLAAADKALDETLVPHTHPTLRGMFRRLVAEQAFEGPSAT
jgi:hypothetical protein